MALQKQVVQIPFGGLQTKADPKVAPLGTYAAINNFYMKQYPELQKRDGMNALGVSTVPDNITTCYNYMNEVGVITTDGLYSYSPSLDQFQLKGQTASPVISSDPIIANTYIQTDCDVGITANNILGSIWEDSRGGVRCAVKDTVSDTYLVSDLSVSTTGVKPKVISLNTQLIFCWVEPGSNTLMVQQYNTLTNLFYMSVSISTSLASCYTYDIATCVHGILVVVVETAAAPDAIKAYYYSTTYQSVGSPSVGGFTPPQSLQFANSGVLPPALSIAVDPTDLWFTISVYNDSNEVWVETYWNYLIPMTSAIQVGTATTDPGWAISSCLDANQNLYLFASSFGTIHNSFQARLSSVNSTPTVLYSQAFILQMGIVSKSFYFNNNAYVILGFQAPLQNTYFGVRDDGACFARYFTQLGGGNIAKANCVTSFIPLPSQTNTFIAALLQTTEIAASANSYFTTTSVFVEQTYFTPSDVDNQIAGNVLNISGGYLKQYDGSATVFEHGFHTYPLQPTCVQSTGSGALTLNGSYSYTVVWEWRDNYGQLHRSEPSIQTEVVLTGTNNTVTVTVPCLPLTNKQTRFGDTRTPVVMSVYRTQSIGTVYYLVNQDSPTFVFNDSLSPTLTFIDTISDTVLGSNSTLYTTGNVFNNVPTPSANLMAICKNVVVLAGLDTYPNQVFFSKPIQPGVGVEFSDELSFIVDSLGGKITALATMDDKILIFKKSLVYYTAGPLPDALGNGTAPYPLLVAADCGCVNPQSLVLTGLGVMFQSPKGIYLIDRQLNVTYIGQQVDRITNPSTGPITVTSAVNLPDKNMVYFTDAINNQVLVYDTYFQQWYTYTLRFGPIASTILGTSTYFGSTSGMYQTIPNQPNDGPYEIQSSLTTNWISLAQLEGYQRIYAIIILGDNANLPHTLNVNLYYDFQNFPSESLTITPSKLFSSAWGTEASWGAGPVWGFSSSWNIYDGTYQFVVRPKEQKCSSIQIEIFDTFPDGSRSQSFTFSGIALAVGIKQSYNKNLSYIRRLT